jgi:hypothetical protein
MKYEVYDLIISIDGQVFEFKSIGKHGSISKKIALGPTRFHGVYNLSFGDVEADYAIDDYSISNNGDRNKILATVARAIDIYTDRYPDRLIYFKGSTKARTRLYRVAISINLEELSEKFEIYAEIITSKLWLPFKKNMEAQAFVVKKKII